MRVQKEKLLKFIRRRGQVTFCDIEKFFDACGVNYKGDTGILLSKPRLVAWNGWNRRASRAFMELVAEGKVLMFSTDMSCAPMPPAFRDANRLCHIDFVPVIIQATGRCYNGNDT